MAEYSQYKKEINDIVYRIPDNRGKGSYIWEPITDFEAIFNRDSTSNEKLNDYDLIRDKYFK